jgi:hypothetical protein
MGQKAGGMTYDDDIEDILGPPSKPKVKARSRGASVQANAHPAVRPPVQPRSALIRASASTQPSGDIVGGVTIFWLAKAFGLEPSTVRKKLADCPPIARKTSGYLYSLPTAAQYLVRPKIDIMQYLEQMKPGDLPQQLQPSYWDSMLKRQKFELSMRQMWMSEDVMEVFSDIFKAIKFSMQLWPDTLERQTGLKDEEREILTALCDDLQSEIYEGVVKLAADKTTPDAWERFLEAQAEPRLHVIANDDDDDDDFDVEDIL